MIRFEPTSGTRFSISGITDFSQFPTDGKTARVTVLEKAGDGWVRISIGGKTLVASGISDFAPGTEFTASLRYSGSTLYIQPIPAAPGPDIFARLGINQTPLSSFLLAFFQTANYRLDSGLFKSILALAARFPGREKRAAEAAAMLTMQGIEPDEKIVAILMDNIEGRTSGSDGGEHDLLAFINQKKAHERHWMTFPFTREVAGRTLSGSVRFLIDTALTNMIRTVITVNDGVRHWDFTIEDSSCTYTHTPDPDTVTAERIGKYLQKALAQAGITALSRSSGTAASAGYSGIDVEI